MYKTQKIFMLMLLVLTPMIPIVNADYQDPLLEIVKGNVPGHSVFHIQGIDEDVEDAGLEILWEEVTFIWPTVATLMNVSSSDVDDTNGGTGTWDVTILGLDADYVQVVETVTMDGQNPVSTVNKYLRINLLIVQYVGTSGANEGIIYIGTGATVGGEPAIIYNEIVSDKGISTTGTYTVPAGYKAYVHHFTLGTSADKDIEFELRTRCVTCAFNSWTAAYHDHFKKEHIVQPLLVPFPIKEKTDIGLFCQTIDKDGPVMADMILVIVDDNYAVINQSYTGSPLNVTFTGTVETTTGANNNTLLFILIIMVVVALIGSSKRR